MKATGNFTVGKIPLASTHTTVAVASSAKMDCTTMSRSSDARENAATPRGVKGSQAKFGSAMALTRMRLAKKLDG